MTKPSAYPSLAESVDKRALRGFVLRRTGDAALAEDVVQDALVRLMEYAGRAEVADPNALAFRIAENLVRDHFRRPRNRAHAPLSEGLQDAAPTAERVVMDRQRLDLVMAVIARMPPKRREVLTRRRIEGQSLEEIAAAMKLTPAAVEKNLARALRALRDELEAELRRARTDGEAP